MDYIGILCWTPSTNRTRGQKSFAARLGAHVEIGVVSVAAPLPNIASHASQTPRERAESGWEKISSMIIAM